MNKQTSITIILSFAILFVAGLNENHRVVNSYKTSDNQQETNITKVPTRDTFFSTNALGNLEKTRVSIPFKFTENEHVLWLYLGKSDGQRIERLLHHPLFSTQEWIEIHEGEISLYQQIDNYETIADFTANPPTEKVAVDPLILTDPSYANLNMIDINQVDAADEVTYILTTYKPPLISGDYKTAVQIIDTSKSVGDKNTLNWHIKSLSAGQDNPYFLGQIQVGYE